MSTSLPKIACIQLNSGPHVEENLSKLENLLKDCARENPTLIALPENFGYFGEESFKTQNATWIQEKIENFLKRKSEELQTYIVAGGYPAYTGLNTPPNNRASFFSPQGRIEYYYNKIHLFDTNPGDGIVYRESNGTLAGTRLPNIIPIPQLGNVGTVVCFDLRFSKLFTELRKKGAHFIVVPAAFTKLTGEAHWEILLRARAIETQCYILAPAQWGKSGNKETFGHSMIIDPWGRVLKVLEEGEGMILAEADLESLESIRNKIPMRPQNEEG